MSWGYDITAIIRGLQAVVRAGAKIQEDYYTKLWKNSSAKVVTESVSTTVNDRVSKTVKDPGSEFKAALSNIKETTERVDVFLEGIKQYALVKLNFKADVMPEPQIPQLTLSEIEKLLEQSKQLKDKRFDQETIQETAQDREIVQVYGSPKRYVLNHKLDHEREVYEDERDDISERIYVEPTLPTLSESAKQRRVPATRLERLATFGGLAATLGLRTLSDLTKGALGLGGAPTLRQALLSPDNAQKIVDTLCKVRGAALKLGQILSIQDDSVIAPELASVFERVRHSADYMPLRQVEAVLKSELGHKWRDHFHVFHEIPFAAASIGQVHYGELHDGTAVAMKVQYPGVAKGIVSDIDNLVGLLKLWNVFPPGMFIDKVVKVAKHELAWEVDYEREAMNSERYYDYFSVYPEYAIPKVIRHLSTPLILTTELMPGVPIDQCFDMPYEDRHMIANSVMKLCLRELFVHRFMQTDPNWSNFLYIKESKQLALIDFGATRDYSKEFIDNYLKVIKAATDDNRDLVQKLSEEMGFLTGYESKVMRDAHINAVMILGEVFSCRGEFDFGKQSTTKRIADLVPVMVSNRLCPPPEEIYSLHRKLSGVFLMCAKLNIKLSCRRMFEDTYNNYKFS